MLNHWNSDFSPLSAVKKAIFVIGDDVKAENMTDRYLISDEDIFPRVSSLTHDHTAAFSESLFKDRPPLLLIEGVVILSGGDYQLRETSFIFGLLGAEFRNKECCVDDL